MAIWPRPNRRPCLPAPARRRPPDPRTTTNLATHPTLLALGTPSGSRVRPARPDTDTSRLKPSTLKQKQLEHLPDYAAERREQGERELGMLSRRITMVIWAAALAVLSALMVCLLIGVAFVGAFIATDLSRPVAVLFVTAVGALTGCLIIFLREISIAAVSARQTVRPAPPAAKAPRR